VFVWFGDVCVTNGLFSAAAKDILSLHKNAVYKINFKQQIFFKFQILKNHPL
jgi:hypothetical protein